MGSLVGGGAGVAVRGCACALRKHAYPCPVCYVSEAYAPPWAETLYYNEVLIVVGHFRGRSGVHRCEWGGVRLKLVRVVLVPICLREKLERRV